MPIHLEVLVEELAAERALRQLLPQLLEPTATFKIHPFQGKRDLLRKLPQRLRAYARWLPAEFRLLVLIDRDGDECRTLKARLDRIAEHAGLAVPSQILNRIAIEELEAWFFGDVEALCAAYPRVPTSLAQRAPYRDPDAIRGGTWESLERVLQRAGYHSEGLPKVTAAESIAARMDPARNRSRSFQIFCTGIEKLVSGTD